MNGTTLELRDLGGIPRFYLAGRLLSGGSVIQLCFSGGWITGRFDWAPASPEGPHFYCSIELAGSLQSECRIPIPDDALVRWA